MVPRWLERAAWSTPWRRDSWLSTLPVWRYWRSPLAGGRELQQPGRSTRLSCCCSCWPFVVSDVCAWVSISELSSETLKGHREPKPLTRIYVVPIAQPFGLVKEIQLSGKLLSFFLRYLHARRQCALEPGPINRGHSLNCIDMPTVIMRSLNCYLRFPFSWPSRSTQRPSRRPSSQPCTRRPHR